MERKVLIANDGMVLTNGETYGKEIWLAEGVSADAYHEITEVEYEALMQEEEPDVLAENEDMKAALNLLGVE